MSYGPSITLARLYRKTSAKGSTYFRGRLGLANVVLLKSREVADDGGEIWELVLQEAPKKPAGGQERPAAPDGPAGEERQQAARHAAARRDWQRPADTDPRPAGSTGRAADPLDQAIPF